MPETGPFSEATARKVSPVLYILVLLCFLLPFMAVSCSNPSGLNGLNPFGGSEVKNVFSNISSGLSAGDSNSFNNDFSNSFDNSFSTDTPTP